MMLGEDSDFEGGESANEGDDVREGDDMVAEGAVSSGSSRIVASLVVSVSLSLLDVAGVTLLSDSSDTDDRVSTLATFSGRLSSEP